MNEEVFAQLTKELITVEDRNSLIRQLEHLSETMFDAKGTVVDKVDATIDFNFKPAVVELLKGSGVPMDNPALVQELIQDLINKLYQLPISQITLAAVPTTELIRYIGSWLKEISHNNLLIEFSVDKRIVAGIIVGHNGTYKDLTYKTKLLDAIQRINLNTL